MVSHVPTGAQPPNGRHGAPIRIIRSAAYSRAAPVVRLTGMSLILLEVVLVVVAVAFFAILDLYVRGLEKL
jgi:hypothetical protein